MNKWKDELVSVITPMHNSERFIGEAIKSVIAQTYTNWEMLIVDDASTDSSSEIVKRFIDIDKRIYLLQMEQNRGIAKARNVGISKAKGRYLAFLDSDDIWLPQKLKIQIEMMKIRNSGFCYSGCYVIDEYKNIVGKERKVPEDIDYKRLLYGNVIPCLTVVLDRKIFGNIKFQNIHHEDYATWLELLTKIDAAIGVQKPLAQYRVSKNTVSSNKLRSMVWVWNIYRKDQRLNLIKSICCIIVTTCKAIIKWS